MSRVKSQGPYPGQRLEPFDRIEVVLCASVCAIVWRESLFG